MKCSSCDRDLPNSSHHCPFCGVSITRDQPPAPVAATAKPDAKTKPHGKTREITKKFFPDVDLPGKYPKVLSEDQGVEKALAEVYQHKEKLRKLLKGAVKLLNTMAKGGKVNVGLVTELDFYLQHHCQICGEYVTVPEHGKPIECEQCKSNS